MNIRPITPDDMNEIRRIHKKFYNFELPEEHYICAFIVEDEGKMVTAGGIRTIAEMIAVTNKDLSPRNRIDGLKMLLHACKIVCYNSGYPKIHAFISDENWYEQLTRHGFSVTNGKALIYG